MPWNRISRLQLRLLLRQLIHSMKAPRRIIIVGGVAGGASAAAKARRVDENAEIHVFERGPYISFANCGLPYFIAGEIEDRAKLIIMTPEKFWARSRVHAHVNQEVLAINRAAKTIRVKGPGRGGARRGLRQTHLEPGREADCAADSRRGTAARFHAARHPGHGPHCRVS